MAPPEFAALLPPLVTSAWRSPLADAAPPFPEESRAIGLVAPARAREFANGRSVAHEALSAAGARPQPLLIRPDRSPDWPAGYCGSISHTAVAAMAVAAKLEHVAALGIDLELANSVEQGLIDSICTHTEWARLVDSSAWPSDDAATAAFCAKEAVYKYQAPLTAVFLEFHDVELVPGPAPGEFSATSSHPDARAVVALGKGRVAPAAGHWLALFWAGPGSPSPH